MKRSKYKDWAVETLRDYQTMKAAADLLPERIKEIDSALNSIKSSAPDAAKVKGGCGVEDARIDKMVEKGLLESNLSNIKTKLFIHNVIFNIRFVYIRNKQTVIRKNL